MCIVFLSFASVVRSLLSLRIDSERQHAVGLIILQPVKFVGEIVIEREGTSLGRNQTFSSALVKNY